MASYMFENDVSVLKVVRNHQVSESLCKLYLDESMADVYFVFHNSNNDETIERVPAHRLILGAACPVFHQMFYGNLKEEGDVLIADFSKDAFAEFLQFFYMNDVVLTTENILEVYQLAHKYDLPKCMDICNDFLIEYLNYDTLPLTMEIALLYEIPKLLRICERMICDHANKVFESEAFLYSGPKTLKHILSMPSLSCGETDLLDACMKWAEWACQRNDILSPTVAQRLNELGDCLHLIRFRSMSYAEFTSCIAKYPDMFTAVELQDTLIFIGHTGGDIERNKRKRFLADDNGMITCSRVVNYQSKLHLANKDQCVRFSTNKEITLCGITIGKRTIVPEYPQKRIPRVGFIVSVVSSALNDAHINRLAHRQGVELDLDTETEIRFEKPIRIVPSKVYDIKIGMEFFDEPIFSTIELSTGVITIGNEIEFTFMNRLPESQYNDILSRGLITDILFKYDGE